ncbi:MAG: hypothetical protein LPK46_01975 [Bacteroidota bacterium]|nr:hypothetical protein [Bacteroidota bacterium]MDX5504885.1 hypothetical protein [Bacteroidota bacterium]
MEKKDRPEREMETVHPTAATAIVPKEVPTHPVKDPSKKERITVLIQEKADPVMVRSQNEMETDHPTEGIMTVTKEVLALPVKDTSKKEKMTVQGQGKAGLEMVRSQNEMETDLPTEGIMTVPKEVLAHPVKDPSKKGKMTVLVQGKVDPEIVRSRNGMVTDLPMVRAEIVRYVVKEAHAMGAIKEKERSSPNPEENLPRISHRNLRKKGSDSINTLPMQVLRPGVKPMN